MDSDIGSFAKLQLLPIQVKTTLDIKDDLLIRAKKLAKRTGRPLRAVVEESLRRTLAQAEDQTAYALTNVSFGDAGADDPLESLTWQDLRNEIYGEPDSR
ncbi:MAG: hypothetical protein RJQ07_06665 [Pseudomonadales bacterium]